MIATIESGGVSHNYPLRGLSGFHRPLNGEAVTVTVEVDFAKRGDFSTPPLGAPVTVTVDEVAIMAGYLTRMVWTRKAVIAEIEG
jgi:hypothetical protein